LKGVVLSASTKGLVAVAATEDEAKTKKKTEKEKP
jgi:hypothetical protein